MNGSSCNGKIKNGNLAETCENEKRQKVTLNNIKENKEENADLRSTLEDSLGQLYRSLCYLTPPEKTAVPEVLLPEETEYNELDKSIEQLDDPTPPQDDSKQDFPPPARPKKRPPKLECFNKDQDTFSDITSLNKDLLRLSLRLNGNRPNTPTLRYGTSSNYSDADSGIGTTTPTKRTSDVPPINHLPWIRLHPELYDLLASPRPNRNTLTIRSNRSYNFDNDLTFPRVTSNLRPNKSFDIENFFLNRLSPTTDYRNFDVASLRSLTIPMGCSDGRKIIKRSETSPEGLLHFNPKSFEDDYSPRASFQRSLTGSFDNLRLPRRAQWANHAQFILACVGYSIGLGNIWRFPYVCYKSGGGAFLVPYLLALLVCGIPLLYMELIIGQLTKRGPIGALGKLCPLLKGSLQKYFLDPPCLK